MKSTCVTSWWHFLEAQTCLLEETIKEQDRLLSSIQEDLSRMPS